jgi:hypothetical protein
MALQALAPYVGRGNLAVDAAVDRALATLSKLQRPSGGFASWGTMNAESCAQVVVALCSLGIDPAADERFIKDGTNVIDALLSFQNKTTGAFGHVAGGVDDGMATEQAAYALVAYWRFTEGKNGLYDMSDVAELGGGDGESGGGDDTGDDGEDDGTDEGDDNTDDNTDGTDNGTDNGDDNTDGTDNGTDNGTDDTSATPGASNGASNGANNGSSAGTRGGGLQNGGRVTPNPASAGSVADATDKTGETDGGGVADARGDDNRVAEAPASPTANIDENRAPTSGYTEITPSDENDLPVRTIVGVAAAVVALGAAGALVTLYLRGRKASLNVR